MNFSDGFKKEAGFLQSTGRFFGGLGKSVKSTTNAIKAPFKPRNIAQEGLGDFAEGFRASQGKGLAGERLGLAKVERQNKMREAAGKPRLSPGEAEALMLQANKDVLSKTQRVRDSRRQSKPSFAAKHPILTGIGTYGAMRMAFGGGNEEKEQQPPPVMYRGY